MRNLKQQQVPDFEAYALMRTIWVQRRWLKTDNLLTGNRYDNIATGQLGSFSASGYLSMAVSCRNAGGSVEGTRVQGHGMGMQGAGVRGICLCWQAPSGSPA